MLYELCASALPKAVLYVQEEAIADSKYSTSLFLTILPSWRERFHISFRGQLTASACNLRSQKVRGNSIWS